MGRTNHIHFKVRIDGHEVNKTYAAGHTSQASAEIGSVEEAVTRGAGAVGEITTWTARLSARAQDLETKVATFFTRVRAA